MSRLPFLAQRLFNVPLALAPAKAEIIMAALGARFGVTQMFNGLQPVSLMSDDWGDNDNDRSPDRGYDVVAGVAIIPVQGTLVAKLGTLRPVSGMTGYDGIRLNFLSAIHDDAVNAIVLDIDSPGGEAAGMFDLADTIFEARGIKSIHAILDGDAYSAAYAIASAADRITVPRTGGTGSVGAIVLHADLTEALTKAGVTVTLIRYGELKYEGSPYEVLSPDTLGRIQADVDCIGKMFVDMVARNRGMTTAAVKKTSAGLYLGAAGVKVGFADAVMAPDAAFSALIASLPPSARHIDN
jgi:signal peptide peptidase SppA